MAHKAAAGGSEFRGRTEEDVVEEASKRADSSDELCCNQSEEGQGLFEAIVLSTIPLRLNLITLLRNPHSPNPMLNPSGSLDDEIHQKLSDQHCQGGMGITSYTGGRLSLVQG
jgi:hypothetical protein